MSFTVNAAAGAFIAIPAINTAYTPTLTLASLTLPAGYAWVSPSTPLNAGNGQTFPATYTAPGGTPVSGSITVNVAQAAGGTFPSIPAINTAYSPSLTLASITLPPGYAWVNPSTPVDAGSGQSYPATYTNPNGNYLPVTGIITVNMAQSPVYPTVNRSVDIAEIPGAVTVNWIKIAGGPEIHTTGRHYVEIYQKYEFNVTYAGGKPCVVKAQGNNSGDTLRLKPVRQADGSFSYIIHQVVKDLKIVFVTSEYETVTTGTERITGVNVYTYNNILTIVSDRSSTADIYTITGTLYRRLPVTDGVTKETLPRGVYVIVIDGMRYKIISK